MRISPAAFSTVGTRNLRLVHGKPVEEGKVGTMINFTVSGRTVEPSAVRESVHWDEIERLLTYGRFVVVFCIEHQEVIGDPIPGSAVTTICFQAAFTLEDQAVRYLDKVSAGSDDSAWSELLVPSNKGGK